MEKNINEQGELVIQLGDKTYYLKYGQMAYSLLVESNRLIQMTIDNEITSLFMWVFYAGVKSRQIKNDLSVRFTIEDADDLIANPELQKMSSMIYEFCLESIVFILRQREAEPQIINIFQTMLDNIRNQTQLVKSEELPIVQESPQVNS